LDKDSRRLQLTLTESSSEVGKLVRGNIVIQMRGGGLQQASD
jgi:hypothetical protein